MKKTLLMLVLVLVGVGLYKQDQDDLVMTKDEEAITADDSHPTEEAMMDGDLMRMVMDDDESLVGKLEDVSGGDGDGFAYVLRRDGTLYHYVEANLPDPAAGLVYEGWLVSKTPSLEFFSTGVMEKQNGKYVLTYEAKEEYLGYDDVVITLETEVDATPEEHILEGLVK